MRPGPSRHRSAKDEGEIDVQMRSSLRDTEKQDIERSKDGKKREGGQARNSRGGTETAGKSKLGVVTRPNRVQPHPHDVNPQCSALLCHVASVALGNSGRSSHRARASRSRPFMQINDVTSRQWRTGAVSSSWGPRL